MTEAARALLDTCKSSIKVVTLDRCADDEVHDGTKYLTAFIIAMVLQGFGAVPLYVLGITYLDDASPHGTASVHMGIYNYTGT